MKLLLDSHALIWGHLSIRDPVPAHAVLEDGANTVLVSATSVWEISIKLALGKLKLAEGWKQALETEIGEGSFTWLPVSRAHCFETIALPWHHRDPFDRLLIAQARVEDAVVVTEDGVFSRYEVRTIWE